MRMRMRVSMRREREGREGGEGDSERQRDTSPAAVSMKSGYPMPQRRSSQGGSAYNKISGWLHRMVFRCPPPAGRDTLTVKQKERGRERTRVVAHLRPPFLPIPPQSNRDRAFQSLPAACKTPVICKRHTQRIQVKKLHLTMTDSGGRNERG